MRLGIKQVLLLGAVMMGVGCVDPTLVHYVGEVEFIGHPTNDYHCVDVTFMKQDGSLTNFRVTSWPPTWAGMRGDILLTPDQTCGYTMVSAKEEK